MIALERVGKTYGKTRALMDVSLQIRPGECVCVTGDTGSGKTTLLQLILGGLRPTAGTVAIDGVDIHSLPLSLLQVLRRRMGYIAQDAQLISTLSVAENVAYPMLLQNMPEVEIERRVAAVLKAVDMNRRAQVFPDELSHGERVRVAVARAVVHRPLILIADEPTSDLDAKHAAQVIELLQALQTKESTIIIACHDPAICTSMRARTIELEDGTIVDDSMGKRKAKAPEEKHEIFQQEPSPPPPAEPIANSAPPKDRQKVRITTKE